MLRFILELLFILPAAVGIVFTFRRHFYRKAINKLAELSDCPFSYRLSEGDGSGYLVFKFDEGIELWCEYGFGIRCDGLYGVDKLTVKGINGAYARSLDLKIGQSIFPIIENMEKFNKWAEDQAFEYSWAKDLTEEWDNIKKKLNNLRVLETKSKEKEKKQK